MNVDFGKSDGAQPVAAVALPEPQRAAPAADNSAPVSSGEALATLGSSAGWRPSLRDVILPRINIVQNSGKLIQSFPFGSLVFDRKLVLFSPPDVDPDTGNVRRTGTPPVTITVLTIHKTRYVEKVKYQSGVRGLIVDTEEAVRAAGGTLDYNEWKLKEASGMKRFEYMSDTVVAIERPEAVADDDTVFVYPINGKKYTLANWALKGTAYTAACKRVFFHDISMGCLRANGYPTFSYSVSTRAKTDYGNTYAVPVCLPNQKSTPEFLEFAFGLIGRPEVQAIRDDAGE